MSDEPDRLASRLFDICVGVLLASMALYGAVQVIRSIWVPLCIGMFVVTAIALLVWVMFGRLRRW